MFAYPCPACAAQLLAPPDRAGQRTICPKCLRPLTIPRPEAVAGSGVDPSAPPPSEYDHVMFDVPTPPTRASVTPPAALATRRPADAGAGAVVLNLPESVDLASELSAAISMRMKPPPDPPADLQLSTGAWLLLSAVGGGLWLAGLAYEPALFNYVGLIGALQAAFGYLWAASLAGRHDLSRGLLTLLPPVAAWRLFRPFGDHQYRPLRFVLTGLLLVGLYAAGPGVRATLPTFTVFAPVRVDPTVPAASPADRLRAAATQKQPDAVLAELAALARPEKAEGVPDDARADMVAELKRLTGHDRADVRIAAVAALATWSPAEARGPALAALRSGDAVERKKALALAPRWPDEEVARAVAARLADWQEQPQAEDALRAIGGPAEAALLPMLKTEDRWLLLRVVDLLEKVGGPATVAALTELSKTGPEKLREEAAKKAEALAGRLKAAPR